MYDADDDGSPLTALVASIRTIALGRLARLQLSSIKRARYEAISICARASPPRRAGQDTRGSTCRFAAATIDHRRQAPAATQHGRASLAAPMLPSFPRRHDIIYRKSRRGADINIATYLFSRCVMIAMTRVQHSTSRGATIFPSWAQGGHAFSLISARLMMLR